MRPKRKRLLVQIAFIILAYISLLICKVTLCFAHNEKSFSIALTGTYPPFSFYKAHEELSGFDLDIFKLLAKHLERELTIITCEQDSILAGLLTDKYDAIIGAMHITAEWAKDIDFSIPCYETGAQLFIHPDNRNIIHTVKDCEGKKIGIKKGEFNEQYLRNNYQTMQILTYQSIMDIFEDIDRGQLIGFISDKLVGIWEIKNANKTYIPAGEPLLQEKIAIVVKKGREDLLDTINTALDKIKTSGEFDHIFTQWFMLNRNNTMGERHSTIKKRQKEQFLKKDNSCYKDYVPQQKKISAREVVVMLIKGFSITIGIALISLLLGLLMAIPAGLLLSHQKGIIYIFLRVIISCILGTPVLIQLLLVYFGAPQMGISLSPITAAILALSINSMAYMSEVIATGLLSVDPGQMLSARALGLSKIQIFRLVLWPQALQIALPSLINSSITLVKDTALVSIIAVGEVVRQAQTIISRTSNPIQYYLIVAAMFFAITFPLMKVMEIMETRLKERGLHHD
ncbi:MAG: ABC transporter substrate-binding protein/permease [bacterium]